MGEVTIIGVDLAKNVFQVHGAAADGSVVFRKKLSRPQFARFMADQPPCLVAMEACASAHHWAREMARHGHEVRLIAPHYVKPFLKRQKNDAADAEAIVEAALRPTMRFVEPKTADQQARAVAFRTREQLVKQRTEAVNALRSHLYEFGHVAPEGIGYLSRLAKVVDDPDTGVPDLARDICRMLLEDRCPEGPDRGHVAGSGDAAQAADDAGRRSDHSTRGRDLRPADGAVPARTRLRRLARPGTAPTFQRWQAEARENLEDGAARYPATACDRSDCGDPLGIAPRSAKRVVARTDAGAQAGPGRGHRAGEQDGARHLGDVDTRRKLSRPGADRRLIGHRTGNRATEL